MMPVTFRCRLAMSAALVAVTLAACVPANFNHPLATQIGQPSGLGRPGTSVRVVARIAQNHGRPA